ncbi:MAG: YihA family ribosome biogenesis GTP-binding protein [Bacteroidaceae bacterium]|nr:YihA family ribosome biogenesis GTP-binding protein [Bacteroidaceae bacterium]
MLIKSAEYVISSARVDQCPQGELPEFAFIGRSNVGKSSLINMLTGRAGLAKTSATPGKTILINHFLINKEWYLVDLPGYGYAKRGQQQRDELQRMITGYILRREQMMNLFLLIDARHEPQRIDLEFIEWLGENGIPFSIVFTKADKLSKGKLAANVKHYLAELSKQWEELPPHFITSSETKLGKDELLDYIDNIIKS